MEQELLLPGIEVEDPNAEAGMKKFVDVEVKTVRLVDPISRGAGDAGFTPMPDDVQNDDVVELDFESGDRVWRQWMTVDQLRELQQVRPARGDGQGEQQIVIPHTWEAADTSRGLGTIVLKTLKIFGIDTPQKLADKGAQKVAQAIAAHFESQIEQQGQTFGLYSFNDPLKIDPKTLVKDQKKLTGTGPYLVFLHGTASSSVGSFGKLAGTDEWKRLQETYGDRVLALEHRTFSVSPIQNALDLAELLPDGARLHLVSHSRGGLIGELMCLAQAGDCRAKFDDLTQAFAQKSGDDDALKAERIQQRKSLAELWDLLLGKKILVERFARVACPAHGTTLASKRMDYLASGLLNAVGLIPGIKGNPALEIGYDWLKSLLLTLVKEKADPRELPGIEAMIPDSPLIQFLNQQDLVTQADLGVIAGDIEVGNLKLTIPALVGNAFFWAQNDLVVNTKAMYDGIRRKQKAYYFFDQGSNVCHFNYFLNPETRSKMNGWLLRDDGKPAENFREVERGGGTSRGESQSVTDWLEKEEPLTSAVPVYTLEISVAHGDLRYARSPVAVGHYDGDGLVSAEKYLDRLLGGRLADRMGMHLYPGQVGTAEVIYGPKGSTPGGALVIGLGETNDINIEVVKQGVTVAALRHALGQLEQDKGAHKGEPISVAFSPLLIGTYGRNALQVKDSVMAIVQGTVNANRILSSQELWGQVRIDRIEFIELYEDVAIQAVHALHDLAEDTSSDLAREVTIKVEPAGLRSIGGGRYQRPVSQYDTYWYGRIQITGARARAEAALLANLPKIFSLDPDRQITQRFFIDKLIEEAVKTPKKRAQLAEIFTDLLTSDGSPKDGGGGLEFLVMTDRARVEASLQSTQRGLVDWLVQQSVSDTRYNKDLSVSLFELLIPNELKNHTENVVLLLDSESAQYPWELLTDRTQPHEPLATRMGIIRQFRTADFRANPRPSRGNYALVVGDTTNTGLADLKGAQDEAEGVFKLLSDHYYAATKLIKEDGTTVINELFAREYQILHIAAHGIYSPAKPDQSGIVLGDGRFLTSKEFVSLRTVPDLIFINCCHLGEIDHAAQRRLENDYPHRLAASVAEELIKMGVKAVVAAGWAVDDAAAKKFAEIFYGEMLKGKAFGEAVLKARVETHEAYPAKNTWGAYQCYGNPNFMLNLQGSKGGWKNALYSRREYRDELRGIAESPDVQNEKRNGEARKQLKVLEESLLDKTLSIDLLKDGEVLTDFGEAWYSLGSFKEAIDFYEKAVYTKDAKASLKAVERLANLKCRYALQLWEATSAQDGVGSTKKGRKADAASAQRKEIQKSLSDAKMLFDWLLKLEPTSERYSLVGKVYKCLATVAETKAERDANLKHAREFYSKGYKAARKNGEKPQDWLYPATNYIACSLLLPGYKKAELAKLIGEGREALQPELDKVPDFWTRVMKPDLDLLERLVNGNLARHQHEVVEAYRKAFDYKVKPNEAESVLSQVQFLITMLNANGNEQRAGLAKMLGAVKGELSTLVDSPGS